MTRPEMTPERWHQLTAIFHRVRALPAGERTALLDHECGNDPSIRQQVEAMLAAHDEAGAFGESPLTLPSERSQQLPPGTMLREFRIEALIGAGGMGEVYRATDTTLGRAVAIKVLPETLVHDPERLSRLDREARVLASINHPHIAAIYALIETPARVEGRGAGKALVLELVEGTTLANRLRSVSDPAQSGRAVPVAEAIALAQQIAAALEAAHDKGVIHRDLKPANIALTHDGSVKVLDFGLAKSVERSDASGSVATLASSSTREGIIVGTAAYMSPEQARGAKVDKRADVWAFGCVLYEMLTGRRAFAGKTVSDTLVAVLERDPDWNALPQHTPPHVRRLLMRTLQRNVALRLRDMGDARLELSQPIDVETVASPSAAPRRRRVALVGAVLAVAAAAMLFVGSQFADTRQAAAASTGPVFRQLTFRRGAVPLARFTADGRNIVYSARWDGRPPESFSGSVDRPESRLLDWPTGVVLAVSKSNEVAVSLGCEAEPIFNFGCFTGTLATAPLAGGAPRRLSTDITHADYAPAGGLALVRLLRDKNVMQLEWPGSGEVVHEALMIKYPRVDPQGTLIAAATRQDLQGGDSLVVISRDGKPRTLSSGWQFISGVAWSGATREIWFTVRREEQSSLRAITLDGRERQLLSVPSLIRLYDISADGAVLLSTETTSNVTVLNGPDEDIERPYSWFDAGWAVGLSADGRMMLFNERGRAVAGRSTMYLRPTDGKSPATQLGEGNALALSPDGTMALALRSTPSGDQLVLVPTGPGDPVPMSRGQVARYDGGYASFFDDGRRVLFYGGLKGGGLRAFVQDSPDQDPRPITPDLAYVGGPGVVSPDMKWVAGSVRGEKPGQVRHFLFPVAGGDPRPVAGLPSDMALIQWTPDGSELYARKWTPGVQATESEMVLISPRTGKLRPFRTLRIADPAGTGFPRGVIITRDGRTYTYSYPQTLQELYVVTGLR